MLYQLERVVYSYPSSGFALKETSLKIKEGEKVAVIGPSGSGKTTFLQILAGLLKPTGGEIFFRSQPGIKANRPGELVMAFQFPENSFVAATVEEEVFLTLREAGFDLKKGEERLFRIARAFSFDLEKTFNRSPFTLSKGEKRKLALISLLVLEPEVIILDEPETGLDGCSISLVYNFLKGLKRETLILATHQIDEAFVLANTFIYLFEGKVVFWGSKEKLALASTKLRKKIPLEFLPTDLAIKWKKEMIC
jgi:energy-coupling factor transport system ATP-binding protein